MNYMLVCTLTGRKLRDHKGNLIVLTAVSERAAKIRFTKLRGFINWDHHIVVEDESTAATRAIKG